MAERTRAETINDYEKYALSKIRVMREQAAEAVDEARRLEYAYPQALWRAEGRFASWDRLLEAAEREFSVSKPVSESVTITRLD